MPVGQGHQIIVVDVQPLKIELINSGKSPIVEPGLEDLLRKGVSSGNLRGTLDVREAVLETDISFLAPPTPSRIIPTFSSV